MADLTSEQLIALSRLFSSGVVQEMARWKRSPLFALLASQSGLPEILPVSTPVRNLFELAFTLLRREGFRHEYIYKAALTQKVLLGKHSLRTAAMLTEFRVGGCKADLAILNGTSTVYEVKSERDSLNRLEKQIAAYAEVFAKIYVIAAETHVDAIARSLPKDVGILRLNRRHQISSLREAVEQPERTSPVSIFDSIRTHEARLVLELHGFRIPTVPNTLLNSVLRPMFVKLSPRKAHDGMVEVLRTTRSLMPLSDLVDQLPTSLQAAALSIPLRKADHSRLVAAVNTPLDAAMAWG
jgi:hypothetical protein